MYNFILQTILMLSLGMIVYLFARGVSKISETSTGSESDNFLEKFIKKLPLEKADAQLSLFLEKYLRKIKIIILRFDNAVTKHLQGLRINIKSNNEEKPTIFDVSKDKDSEKKDNL